MLNESEAAHSLLIRFLNIRAGFKEMRLQLWDPRLWFTSCIALVGACFLVLFLKKPSAPTSNSKNFYPRNTTFRLQGIPALLSSRPASKVDVICLIRKAWNIDDGTAIVIHSLATDPSDDTKKIATLAFNAPAQFMSRPAQKWTTALRGDGEDSIKLALDLEFFGLTPLHREADADCTYDIVALPGLNGHAFGSFKQRGESSFMWLRDALPQHLTLAGVHARVFTYGYDSRLIKSDSFQEISDLGLEFKNKIVQLTQSSAPSGMRRLILIGHSLGGILVKQAITSLDKNIGSVHEKRTLERLLGSMFFGTPSQGMDIETMLPMVDGQPNELLVRTLGPSSGMLRNQMNDFRNSFERMSFSAVWYYETTESPTSRQCENGGWTMDGPKRRLVDISSATNGMPHDYGRHTVRPVKRNHSDMVKFQGSTDEVYRQALADLKNIMFSPTSVMVCSLTKQQEEFLGSLDFKRQDSRRDSISRATENTCEWFFRSHEFRAWIDSESNAKGKGLLWVKGNPGVGKSTLMREALRRTQDYVSQASTSIVSFFFNARGEELEKTTQGLYRSFLHQILKYDLNALAYLLPDYLEKKTGKIGGRVEWTEELLKDYVSRVCQRGISMPVLIFIDALDECTNPEISRLVEFFQGLVDHKKDTNANLRVCISSRHCPRPPTFGYPEITVEHHNKDDIYTYIETELKNYRSLLELRDPLFERSSGVFLWVRLAIKKLREEEDMYSGRPMSFLKKRLTDIPPELGELFGSLLGNIHPAEHRRVISMFQLVLFTEERLSAGYIAAVMSFHSETRFQTIEEWTASGERINGLENQKAMIINLSGGLLEFDKDERSTCQFIHESVRDYFLRYGGFKSLSIPQDNLHVVGWCHSGLVTSTVNYSRAVFTGFTNLFLKVSETFENRSNKKRLKREGCGNSSWINTRYHVMKDLELEVYNPWNILTHIEIAEKEGFSQEASLRTLNQMLAEIYPLLPWDDAIYNGLHHVCCRAGMKWFNTASRLIGMGEDPRSMVNKWGELYGAYPLSSACRENDSGPLVELLLRKGAEVNARDKKNKTALMRASQTNDLDVVQLLISHGADVQVRDHKGKTALHKAASETENPEIIQLLLSHGADVQVLDHKGKTALHKAASTPDKLDILQLLLSHGSDVHVPDHKGRTVLHKASSTSHTLDVIQLLLSYGADIQARDYKGKTALHKAVRSLDGTEWLLMLGADPNAEDNKGQTPLITAGLHGLFKSFPLLINAGANVNHRTPSGKTALLSALSFQPFSRRHKIEKRVRRAFEAIQSLIQNGLDLHARDENGSTAYDLWKPLEQDVREDPATYRLWKEVERSLRLDEGGKSEHKFDNVLWP